MPRDRRRQHGDDEGVLDPRQPLEQFGLDGGSRLARILGALLERIEHQKQRAGIGRIGEGRAGEADDIHGMRDARHLERDVEHALLHLVGARQRRAGRQLHDDDDVAAVDLRDEADRRGAERVQADGDHDQIDRDHHDDAPHGSCREPRNAEPDLVEAAIEIAEEAVDRPLPPGVAVIGLVRLEQQRAHRRRQRQRHDQRNDGGARDGQRELPVELARICR